MLTVLWLVVKWTAAGIGLMAVAAAVLTGLLAIVVALTNEGDGDEEPQYTEEELIAHGDAILRAMEDDL